MDTRNRSKQAKTAIVLAGGGLTGAVYEIGALRALDDLLLDRTVNDFDIYVGTSAGALVSTLLALGISPQLAMEGLAGTDGDVPAIQPRDMFALRAQDVLRCGLKLPRTVIGAWSHYVRHFGDMTMFDLVWLLLEALPSGFYDNDALEAYLERVLALQGRSNHFEDLDRELYIVATDLDSGQREVFCKASHAHVPLSRAVSASTAVPVLYKPVIIDGHEYVDGAARGNASLDLAIEQGAKLIVCINPLVPLDNRAHSDIPVLGPDAAYLSEKGLSAVASQVTRINAHSALHYHIKQLRKRHHDVDIVLVEPSRHDYQMFFYNAMRYSARLTLAQHGLESVTQQIANDFAHYQQLFAGHGIYITPDAGTRAPKNLPPKRRRAATRPLRRALDDLERTLEQLETQQPPPQTALNSLVTT